MAWKKSEDGGLDYDVSQDIQSKDKPFDPFATAYTTTFSFNIEQLLPPPKSRKEQIQEKINAMKRTKYKYF
ncbi:MAG: hypothetical protein JW866_00090 [Ignavibacteriales bacterium]|nr:hypothetical protein [Ignavibacteriales bacterium]